MPLDGLAALRTALTPLPVPWGVGPGLRAAVAAGLVLGGSLLVADLKVGGIAYLGVACAVSFVGRGDYRSRAANVGAQAVGAAVGMTVGALVPDAAPWVISAAVVVGVLAGMVGRIGPASTGGAVMAVIGVAYTQFGRLAMPWWEPVLAYLVGSALVLALSLVGAVWHRDRYRRAAVAAVFDAAADLVAAAPGAAAEQARHRLALASAAARQAVAGYRIRPVGGPLHAAWSAARAAAATAAETSVAAMPGLAESSVDTAPGSTGSGAVSPGSAECGVAAGPECAEGGIERAAGSAGSGIGGRPEFAEGGIEVAAGSTGRPVDRAAASADVGHAWRCRAREVRAGELADFTAAPPARGRAVGSVLRSATTTAALWVGARIGLCVGLATALAILLHPPQHAFWIPLTVAVVLRPEYGAVLVRSVHRFLGTVVGVVAVAVLVTLTSTPAWLALAAALALGGAAFAAPRVYGLAVVGITGSALLSVAVGDPQGVQVWARLLDTALGCALALVVGVLLWPRRGLPDQSRVFATGVAALTRQIGSASDEAYRFAHDWRAELERGLAEPDPARAAAAWLPVAIRLEHAVDVVAATGGDRAAALALLAGHEPVTTPAQASRLLTRVVAGLP
jgi:uncharacterized membrane protein YccC